MVGLQGRVFGGYQLADQLTSGSIAEVYRGRPSAPGGREVVIKIIYPELAQQSTFRARFDQIVQSSQRLSHPHILPLLESGEQNGYLYLVTPFVAAGTFRDWLRAGHRLGAHDVAPFFRQLCEAAGYAHSQGVVHGNIKPSNIFLHEGRHVLLGDFGRLWDIGQMDMTHAGAGVESVEDLAPEAVEGRADLRGDVYSLGCVLFTGLTGRPPFSGATPFEVCSRHAREPVPHLWDHSPAAETGIVILDQVVQQAMAKLPDVRFPSALALAQAIETAIRTPPGGMGMPMPTGGFPPLGGMGLPPGTPGMASAALLLGGSTAGLPAAMANAVAPGAVFSPSPLGTTLGASSALPASPLSGLVEPGMEEGRVVRGGPPSPRLGGFASLPTTALPAQPGAPGASGGWPMGGGGRASGAGGAWANGTGSHDLPAQATLRVPAAGGGAPSSSTPSTPSGPATPATPLPPSLLPPSDALGPLGPGGTPPAVEASAPAPSGAGFMVAGGNAHWPPATTDLVGAPGGPPAPAAPPEFGSGLGGAGAFGSEMGGGPAGAGDVAGGERTFSATSLGLPRLTMPELDDMPPGWQESASAQWQGDSSPPGVGEEPPDRWGPHAPWGTQPGRWGESGQWDGASQPPEYAAYGDQPWGESSADNRGYPGGGGGWSADMPAAPYPSEWDPSGSLASVGAMHAADASGKQQRRGMPGFLRRRGKAADPEEEESGAQVDPFADPSAWASPSDLDRRSRVRGIRDTYSTRPPRRWGRLLLIAMLLIAVDSALLVAVRPDLCPHNACAAVSARVKQYVGQLNLGAYFMPHSPLATTPASVSLQTYAGGTVSTNLTLKNPAKTSADWAATATLPWLSVAPASGALPSGASAKLVLTARPGLAVHPDTYAAQLQVKVGNTVLNVPVNIALAPAPRLSVSPATLTFTRCQTSQQVTVTNTGGGPLSFTATPLESTLSLDVTSGTLAPGAKRKITVTLDCSATTGSTYGINLVSNGGSAAITVSFS